MKLDDDKRKKILEDLSNIGINNLIKKYNLDKYEVATNYLKNYYSIGTDSEFDKKIRTPFDIGYAALDKTLQDYIDIYTIKKIPEHQQLS